MRRREFIAGLGGASVLPIVARAQQRAMPVIGYLNDGTLDASRDNIAGFRRGLAEVGYVEGQNVQIEFRATNGQIDQLPALAADLVSRRVAVIAGLDSTLAVRAAKAATATIPIVFFIGGNPVNLGLVVSFNRPGGNVTGVSSVTNELGPKRLGLLHALVPNATTIAALVNPANPNAQSDANELQAAARSLGLTPVVHKAINERDIDQFFAMLVERRIAAFIITPDRLFGDHLNQLVVLAAYHKIPGMFNSRRFTLAGGLVSYGTDIIEMYRQVGVYTGQVLKGTRPADLPIVQPTKFEFIINRPGRKPYEQGRKSCS
jgi:putative tryptophan/tyrosine transport system substrate-binding protein